MLLGVAGKLAELFFNLVGLPFDCDGNLPISRTRARVDRVPVQLLFADVEADHQFVVGVYSTGQVLYLHGKRSHCSGLNECASIPEREASFLWHQGRRLIGFSY